MIKRTLSTITEKKIGRGKAIMIVGARQVGKTTLIKEHLKDVDQKPLLKITMQKVK